MNQAWIVRVTSSRTGALVSVTEYPSYRAADRAATKAVGAGHCARFVGPPPRRHGWLQEQEQQEQQEEGGPGAGA
jgi:hypothetical protein